MLLGTSAIKALAIYPYQQSAGGSVTSNVLTEQVYGMPMKQLAFTAKSKKEAIVTETIRDILGNPIQGAEVQFSVEPTGPQLVKELGSGPASSSTGSIVLTTDENGQVAVDVISSLRGRVDVLAENLGTRVGGAGVLRDMLIDYSGSLPTVVAEGAANDGTGGGGTNTGGGSNTIIITTPGTTVNTTTTVTTTTEAAPVAAPIGKTAPAAAARVTSAKLVVTKVGRYVTVKVTSPSASAKVMVKLVGKGGKILKQVTRTVPTNKVVRIGGLTVPKLTRGVTAGVVR